MMQNELEDGGNSNNKENTNDEEIYGPAVEDNGWIPKLFENNYRTTQLIFTKKNGRTFTCLRQPRDLYTSSKSDIHLNIWWPSEAQIYSRRPLHILYTPPKPELLHKKEKDFSDQLDKSANVFGKVVYDNSPDPEIRYFVNSKTDPRTTSSPAPYYTLKDESDNTLQFESRFESGNLMRAIKTGEYEYQLWLKFDLYTKKHTQWFYFQVKNAHPNKIYKFTIMNFLKSGSLYNEGMKPLLYSERDAQEKKIGWIRAGTHIKYYKNDIKIEENKERTYYSLHWRCSFANDNDTYYLAHSYPYTYSDLQEYLMFLSNDPQRKKCCKQRVLCQTLAGNQIYLLTITTPTRCPKQAKIKRTIVITARIHPGETIGSWMMKGLLDYLTSNEADAKILRETFIFKIIPMLNPDGVIVGNYRCSLAGRDLNRNYKTVLKDSFPPVWSTKYLVKKLQEEREVVLYCDLHGHSRKKNIFVYGCENKQEKLSTRLNTRFFPYILAKNAPDKFSFTNCRFRVQKNKEGTGRVVMWNTGIRYSYTLEASFCGSSSSQGTEEYHYGVQDYEEMGYHFCDSLLDLFDPDKKKLPKILDEIKKKVQSTILRKMITTGKSIPTISTTEHPPSLDEVVGEQYFSDIESESCGSDSSASDGLPMQLLHASIPEITKKKRLKSRKERNKSRKQRQKHKNTSTPSANIKESTPTDPSPSQDRIKVKRKTKRVKPEGGSSGQIGRMAYTSRTHKSDCQKCLYHDHADCFDRITNSYVQAGLLDKESSCHGNNTPPCEKCNPSFYFYDTGDDPVLPHHLSSYSLYDMRMPSYANTEVNPTLELARRITAFNYRNGKVPQRMSRMFAIWSNLDMKKDEPPKRNLLNQGDNLEYFTNRLKKVHSSFTPNKKPIKTTLSEKNLVDQLVYQHSQAMNRLHSTRNVTNLSSQSTKNHKLANQTATKRNTKHLPKLDTLSPTTSSISPKRMDSSLRGAHAQYMASRTTSQKSGNLIGLKPPSLDDTSSYKERISQEVYKPPTEKRLLSQKDILGPAQYADFDAISSERCKSGRRSAQRASPDMRAITPQQYFMYPQHESP